MCMFCSLQSFYCMHQNSASALFFTFFWLNLKLPANKHHPLWLPWRLLTSAFPNEGGNTCYRGFLIFRRVRAIGSLGWTGRGEGSVRDLYTCQSFMSFCLCFYSFFSARGCDVYVRKQGLVADTHFKCYSVILPDRSLLHFVCLLPAARDSSRRVTRASRGWPTPGPRPVCPPTVA